MILEGGFSPFNPAGLVWWGGQRGEGRDGVRGISLNSCLNLWKLSGLAQINVFHFKSWKTFLSVCLIVHGFHSCRYGRYGCVQLHRKQCFWYFNWPRPAVGFADPSSELWIICKSYICSHDSYLLIIFFKTYLFMKKKWSPKLCGLDLKKQIVLLCYNLGEVAINCQWTLPILWETSTSISISSLKAAVCAEIS